MGSGEGIENGIIPQEEQAVIKPLIADEVRSTIERTKTRYKVPLAELVSKIVSSKPEEFTQLKESVKKDFKFNNQTVLHVKDWEKALHDEAQFQFSSEYRPIVEAILNGIDTEHRREAKTGIPLSERSVDVEFTKNGFIIQDQGEGMDLETIFEKLLVPKISGNNTNDKNVVGRFGVGFYSLLSYLKQEGDTLIVRTNDGQEGWRVSIGRASEEHGSKYTVVISPLNQIDSAILKQGTEVEINTAQFEANDAANYVADTLKFKQDAVIRINNRVINNSSDFTVLEKNLSDISPSGQSKIRLYESKDNTKNKKVILSVGGVMVESFVPENSTMGHSFVIDLPTVVSLPKSRDKIELNNKTILVFEEAMELLFQGDTADVAERINAFSPVMQLLQKRNPYPQPETNLRSIFEDKVHEWMGNVPSSVIFLPDIPGIENIAIPDSVKLSKDFLRNNKNLLPYESKDFKISNGKSLFVVPFDSDDILISGDSYLFLNEKYITNDPRRVGVLNAYLHVYDLSTSIDRFKVNGTIIAKEKLVSEDVSASQNESLRSSDLGLSSQESEKREPLPLIDRFTHTMPTTVEEFQDRWIESYMENNITDLLNGGLTDAAFREHRLPRDGEFWNGVITDDFLKQVKESLFTSSKEDSRRMVIDLLPADRRQEFMNFIEASKLGNVKNAWQLGLTFAHVLDAMYPLSQNTQDQQAILRAKIMYSVQDHINIHKKIFVDKEFLHTILYDPLLAKEFFAQDEQGVKSLLGNEYFEPLGGYLHNLEDLENTEERRKFALWYLRNKDFLKNFRSNTYAGGISLVFKNRMSPYEYGIDGAEQWQTIHDNHELLQEALSSSVKQKIRSAQGEWGVEYSGVIHAEILRLKEMNPENLAMIEYSLDRMENVYPEFYNKYFSEIITKADIPQPLFKRYSDLLLPVGSTDPRLAFSPSWIAASSGVGEVNDMLLPTTVKKDIVQRRLNLLENLPPEYTAIFLGLSRFMANSMDGKSNEERIPAHLKNEEKISKMIRKIAELPEVETLIILKDFNQLFFSSVEEVKKRLLDKDTSIKVTIRPWLLYLFSESDLEVREKESFFEDVSMGTPFLASELVAKYLSTEEIEGISDTTQLYSILDQSNESHRAKELGQRRIEHAVNYQSAESYIWLRELVQNAYNATRGDENKTVAIDNYLQDEDFVIDVTDPHGMTFKQMLNSLLIPQKSNWEHKDALGYFGHGFFTTFKSADTVRIKSSLGDGQTNYITIKPQRDPQSMKVMDLEIVVGRTEEQFQGTTISWIKETDFPDFEAARAQSEIITYAGLIPAEELSVKWNDEKINRDQPVLSRVDSAFGPLSIFDTPGENILTQHGLFIKEVDQKYLDLFPVTLQKFLSEQGITIDLPANLSLIDSRADIANRTEVLQQISKTFAEAGIKAAVELFKEGRIDFDRLPYDFFYEAYRTASHRDPQVEEDVLTLINNPEQMDWVKYMAESSLVIQLIISLPTLNINGREYSLLEAIKKSQSDQLFMRHLPPKLGEYLRTIMAQRSLIKKTVESSFYERGYEENFDFIPTPENTPENADTYLAWQDMYRSMLEPTILKTGNDYIGTYYSSSEDSVAHYINRSHEIGWNLTSMEEYMTVLSGLLKQEQPSSSAIESFYTFLAEIGSHEYQHRLEKKAESLTHNIYFYQGQKIVLEDIIRTFDPQVTEQKMRDKYNGGLISTTDYSRLSLQ